MKLEGKIAIITDGSSGIGEAVAKRFSAEGASVVIGSLHKEKGDEMYSVLGGACISMEMDVREEEDVRKLIDHAIEKFGKIDIVVNSAGIYATHLQEETAIPDIPYEDFRKVLDTNFTGIFLMTKHALPHLLKTNGNIVNIASALGLVPERGSAIYCASKSAVVMFITKATALDYAEKGVRINAVCPGPIDTPMLRAAFHTEEALREYEELNPMKRSGTASEVANVVFFLASPEASYVTGATYTIDGGEALK